MTEPRSQLVSIRELREFGLLTGAIFISLFGLLFPWIRHHQHPQWPFALGAILIAAGLLYPAALRWPFAGWTFVGGVLGWINSRIVLSLMFYLVITPMGLVMRLFGGDPMHRKRDPKLESYRVASRDLPANHVERPF